MKKKHKEKSSKCCCLGPVHARYVSGAAKSPAVTCNSHCNPVRLHITNKKIEGMQRN